jgi:6-pyruvoyltetrahydropterin/6-carboxytetrahydropterin synthase
MLITRRVDFSASHVCARPDWPPERNLAVYGDAARPHGHGHNYVLEVTVNGEPDPITGMIIDLKELKEIVSREVVDPMDHRFLNLEVPPFDKLVPTTENLAMEIFRRLRPHVDSRVARLHAVKLYETEDLYVEYFGEAA